MGHESRNSRRNLEARLLSTAATAVTEVASCALFQVKGYEISQPRGSSVDPLSIDEADCRSTVDRQSIDTGEELQEWPVSNFSLFQPSKIPLWLRSCGHPTSRYHIFLFTELDQQWLGRTLSRSLLFPVV